MELELILTKANGQSQSVRRDLSRFSDAYMLFDVVVDVRETNYDGEYVICFQPQKDIALKKIELSFEFDPRGAFVYNSGAFGSSDVSVVLADNPIPFSRDVFLAANVSSEDTSKRFFLNLAFTSFERFFTYFSYVPGRVSAVYNLENRTVQAGTIIRLENIMIDDTVSPGLFLDSVAETIAVKHKLKNEKVNLFGWAPSGCADSDKINEESLKNVSDSLKSLSQDVKGLSAADNVSSFVMSDGYWQKCGPFSCIHTVDDTRFPGGLGEIAEYSDNNGQLFGISYSPALIADDSPLFKEYNYRMYDDRNYKPSFSNVYPLNPVSQDLQSDICSFLKSAVVQDGIGFLKFDNTEGLLLREDRRDPFVYYNRDYSVAVFRNLLKAIRRASGNTALLAGSGPIGEFSGIFDLVTVSAGIGSDNSADDPSDSFWHRLTAAVLNIIYRSFYNGRLFRTYVPGLMLGGSLTGDEAILVALTLAFSGGSIVLSDLPQDLPEETRKMICAILPPAGIVCKPLDFWEYPLCTHTVASVPDKAAKTEIHVLYNFNDFEDDRLLKVTDPCIFINMMTGQRIATARTFADVPLKPHSAVPVLVKYLPEHPALIMTDENIYRGCGNTSDMFFSDTLIITSDAPGGVSYYIYVPYGRSSDVYLNEKKLRLNSLEVTEAGEGNIYKYKSRIRKDGMK